MRSLAEVLQAELEVVRQLITACREEQAALITNDLAGIQAATARKGDLARRLGELEQERQQVMMLEVPDRAASTTRQVQRGQVTGASPPPTDFSEALRATLRQAVREFQEINDTNRLLTRQSLAYVQKILSLLVPEGTLPAIMDRVV
ncbi:flagellar protein FlgN [Moorella naiadis]|uniref:flagellar protein FlgN n=1 Tax=Moorella naiadis (nom. illeg.) TaxID=3093670 RepID=UPI003D9CAD06